MVEKWSMERRIISATFSSVCAVEFIFDHWLTIDLKSMFVKRILKTLLKIIMMDSVL